MGISNYITKVHSLIVEGVIEFYKKVTTFSHLTIRVSFCSLDF